MPDKIIHKQLSYKLCGICFNTHNELGRFRSEKSYGDLIEKLLKEGAIEYKREYALPPSFDGEKPRRNIVDFLVDDKIVLELKTKPFTTREDYFQMKRYLHSADKRLGIIVNFRQKHLSPKRILN